MECLPVKKGHARALRGFKRWAVPLLAAFALLAWSWPAGATTPGFGAEPVVVYFARNLPTKAGLIPVSALPPAGMSPERGALEQLIKGPPAGSGLDGMLPEGTRVLGLEIAGGLATVNFSRELLEQSYGSMGEALLLGSIVNTLTRFPSIERVWILVEGQAPGSLGGHVDITEPLRHNPNVVLSLGFDDVRGHWAEGYVHAFYFTGMVDGYPDGTFLPERILTREEFVKLLVLAAGHDPVSPGSATFADVDQYRWSYGYVEAGVEAGIVRPQDYGSNFDPAARLSRREMAVLLVRAAGQDALASSLTSAELPYNDLSGLPGWAWGYVAAATQLGLMNGYPDGSFRPSETSKRSEAMTVLSRFLHMSGGPIFMVTPRDGAVVGDSVLVVGVAQVFEATVQVRVRTAGGGTYAGLYTMATNGAPEYGIYAALLPTPEGPGENLLVEAYEISAKDGSEVHVVSRQVQRGP